MAFKNIKLTPEQRDEFEKKNIINPETMRVLKPMFLTVDENDSDTWLTWCYNHRETGDFMSTYLLSYKRILVQVIVVFRNLGNNACDWSITYTKIIKNETSISNDEAIPIIKKIIVCAFLTYKATGHASQSNESVIATCCFEEGVEIQF
jgi:hypothetical protein